MSLQFFQETIPLQFITGARCLERLELTRDLTNPTPDWHPKKTLFLTPAAGAMLRDWGPVVEPIVADLRD